MEILSKFTPLALFFSSMVDLAVHLTVVNGPLSLLLHADYQDWVTTLLHHSPELLLALSD